MDSKGSMESVYVVAFYLVQRVGCLPLSLASCLAYVPRMLKLETVGVLWVVEFVGGSPFDLSRFSSSRASSRALLLNICLEGLLFGSYYMRQLVRFVRAAL